MWYWYPDGRQISLWDVVVFHVRLFIYAQGNERRKFALLQFNYFAENFRRHEKSTKMLELEYLPRNNTAINDFKIRIAK